MLTPSELRSDAYSPTRTSDWHWPGRHGEVQYEIEPGVVYSRSRGTILKSPGGAALATVADADWLPVLIPAGASPTSKNRRIPQPKIAIKVSATSTIQSVTAGLTEINDAKVVSAAPGFYMITLAHWRGVPSVTRELVSREGVEAVEPQLSRWYQKFELPNDPLFPDQWHLMATSENGGSAGYDLDITNAWKRATGKGIYVGVVDDGVEVEHPDLKDNLFFDWAKDYVDDDSDVSENNAASENHGTSVIGLLGAVANNHGGIVGAAYDAKVVPIRLITAKPISDEQIVNALSHTNDLVAIKSNSWGTDGIEDLSNSSVLVDAAIEEGSKTGRGGRGEIYVFSAGNEGHLSDNLNYTSLKVLPFCIPVGAIRPNGLAAYYTTPGAALVVVAPAGQGGDFPLVTTDVTGGFGRNQSGFDDLSDLDYTRQFAGTSGAAPLVSGVIAMMLEVNPELGWRDVQEILMRSARQNAPDDSEWKTNSGGFRFHHKFGAGLVQADAALRMADHWENLPPVGQRVVNQRGLQLTIPDDPRQELVQGIRLDGPAWRTEMVQLALDIRHPHRGELSIELISPSGMVSELTQPRGDTHPDYQNWIFLSRRHWAEDAVGEWRVRIRDHTEGSVGTLRRIRLEAWGTPINPVEIIDSSLVEVSGESNENQSIQPGETVGEKLTLRNIGNQSFTNLTVEWGDLPIDLSAVQRSVVVPRLGAGQTLILTNSLTYHVAPEIACGTTLFLDQRVRFGRFSATNAVVRTVGKTVATAIEDSVVAGSLGLPLEVPDLDTAFATNIVALADNPIVESVRVAVRLDHTTVGDTQISLIHPDGTEIILSKNRGGDHPNLGRGDCESGVEYTVYSDSARLPVGAGRAPLVGNFRPDEPLVSLRGKPANGTWVLRLSDVYDDDSGNLLCWELRLGTRSVGTNCEVFATGPRFISLRSWQIDSREPHGPATLDISGALASEVILESSLDMLRWTEVTGTIGDKSRIIVPEGFPQSRKFLRVRLK